VVQFDARVISSRPVASGSELWHNSAVPVFLEKFVLTLFAGAVIVLALTNPMKFDTTQRITGTVALIFAAYFVAQTIYKRNEKKKRERDVTANSN